MSESLGAVGAPSDPRGRACQDLWASWLLKGGGAKPEAVHGQAWRPRPVRIADAPRRAVEQNLALRASLEELDQLLHSGDEREDDGGQAVTVEAL